MSDAGPQLAHDMQSGMLVEPRLQATARTSACGTHVRLRHTASNAVGCCEPSQRSLPLDELLCSEPMSISHAFTLGILLPGGAYRPACIASGDLVCHPLTLMPGHLHRAIASLHALNGEMPTLTYIEIEGDTTSDQKHHHSSIHVTKRTIFPRTVGDSCVQTRGRRWWRGTPSGRPPARCW